MDNSRQSVLLDKVAVALSGLCLLHCLLLPVAVAILPFVGQLSGDHFHIEMLLFVVPVSVIALTAGFRRHRRREILAFGALGLLVLAIGGTVIHELYGDTLDRILTVTGSLILAGTHFRNFRLAQRDLKLVS